jgi:hypothetical protein
MIYLIFILFFLFLIGSPFVLIFHWLQRKNKKTITTPFINSEDSVLSESHNAIKYSFMEDYKMWKDLSLDEKKVRLMDIDVIFREGKDSIKKEMIKQGFTPGSKIIDINYFTGLSEHGFTITGFLIQNEAGGEIRELVININLEKMEFIATRNLYHSSGQERYYYLKNRKGLIEV